MQMINKQATIAKNAAEIGALKAGKTPSLSSRGPCLPCSLGRHELH